MKLLYFSWISLVFGRNCSDDLQLIVDYVKWRDLRSVQIHDPRIANDVKRFYNCFSTTDLYLSLHASPTLAVRHLKGRPIGIVLDSTNPEPTMDENISWLVIANGSEILDDFTSKTLNFNTVVAESGSYRLVQLYKVRNSSLLVRPCALGRNFHRIPLKFGKRNQTGTDGIPEKQLMEISSYFREFLNATSELVHFEKLDMGGEWGDLLGAVVNEDVDLGLDGVIMTPERYTDMTFTHKIFTSVRSIYIRRQASRELRDIYLAPFGGKLVLCVLISGTVLSLIMGVIARTHDNSGSFGEATLWCIGIFAMQGSVWTPGSYSGNIILITCLGLAVVIFNSYSAFITSVLSVEVASIRSVADLLSSDYSIGYVKNGPDENYLRAMNDTQLQLIYLRGYLHNDVLNISRGLERTRSEKYAFFASANAARNELRRANRYKCDSDMMEIQMASTRNAVAFPLAKRSPFRQIFNQIIIRMYETGVHKYIQDSVAPRQERCREERVFRSAHLSDLSSAFGILIVGIQISVLLVILEGLWKNKRRIWSGIGRSLCKKRDL